MFRRTSTRAFTLIELMVVVVILGILAGVLVKSVVGKSDKAKRVAASANIAIIEGSLDEFYLDMGRYPTTEEGLRVLFYSPEDDEGEWGGPYLRGDQLFLSYQYDPLLRWPRWDPASETWAPRFPNLPMTSDMLIWGERVTGQAGA